MIYTKGLVNIGGGTPSVFGIGTKWSKRVKPGDVFQLEAGGEPHKIAVVVSDTQLKLSNGFSGGSVSSGAYVISSDFSRYFSIAYPKSQDIQKASVSRRAVRKIDSLLGLLHERVLDIEFPGGVLLNLTVATDITSVSIPPAAPAGLITADSLLTADSTNVTADGLYTP
jgi:hypothetical protein